MTKPDEQEKPPPPTASGKTAAMPPAPAKPRRVYLCDRCGFEMFETNCKVVCPNCGSRYDCSDLNLNFE